MYLSELYIENYKSIKKLDLKFEKGKNIIVGKNNSGKSNIIKAIDLVLGESSPTWNKSENITDDNFYMGNITNEIFISCKLTKDSDEQINLSNFKGSFFTLKDKCSQEQKRITLDFNNKTDLFEFCGDEGQAKIDEFRKEWIGNKSYCSKTVNDELNENENFILIFRAKKEDGLIVKDLVFLYKKNSGADWIISPNANLRCELLQSAIIPSFRDPKDQLRITSYTWFGKLLKTYIKGDNPDLKEAFEKVKESSDVMFKELQDKLYCENTQIAFPNNKISFQFNPDSKQDVYKSTLIYIDDGFNSKLSDKGSGIQSSVIIGLFDYYVRNISENYNSLLVVEEPEIYLHPHGRRVISNKLDKFLNEDKNQVIITTHSTEFICTPHENINLIVVRKSSETTAKNFYFSDIKTKQVLIKKQNAEMFFADVVILTEGADKYIIESIAQEFGKNTKVKNSDSDIKLLGENWLNDYNISVINCGGKHELWKYSKILQELNISFITVADFDFLRDGLNNYFTKLSFEQEFNNALNTLKSKIQITGKYKQTSEINDNVVEEEIRTYLKTLEVNKLFLLSGELEHFYIISPRFDKEGGVIETISKLMESSDKTIHDFVNVNEFENILKKVIQDLDLEIIVVDN